MSRAQTVVLALLLMSTLMGGLCLVVARGERASAALRQWAWGTILFALGLLITLLPLTGGARQFSLFIGNCIIAWAPVWAARGAIAYSPLQFNMRWVHALLALTIGVLALNALRWQLPVVNLVVPTQIAIVLFVLGGVMLWRAPAKDAGNASRFLSLAMWLSALDWILRTAFVLGVLGASQDRERADFTIAMFAVAQMLLLVASTMAIFWMEVRRMEATLSRIAFFDTLTELPNRRATLQRFQLEQARAARTQQQRFALLVMDLDHFKKINDGFGHHVGDLVLQHFARVLESNRRSQDFLGRIGGEEFIMLLFVDQMSEALQAATRLQICLSQTPMRYGEQELTITFSGGLSMFGREGKQWDELFTLADQRAYQAKQNGRNQICVQSLSQEFTTPPAASARLVSC
jgi:diguanylate cyclase (GGDEF)-like protein